MPGEINGAAAEIERIRAEYGRRQREISPNRYAPWQPALSFSFRGRRQMAALMLHQADVFPKAGDPCLEVGFGSIGWLGELITWGVRETDLHGVELDPGRARRAQESLPLADLRIGSATELPYERNTFRLVIASTVFTSILDTNVRGTVAAEISRVLAPGGALLWYDFAFNNPWNSQVRKVNRRELRNLFPLLTGKIRSLTLAPPLARLVRPWSWTCAALLEAIPLFRTHLLAVLVKT
jgi:ubiquinone/menaquinone biosynthesis C-methylase UbiE